MKVYNEFAEEIMTRDQNNNFCKMELMLGALVWIVAKTTSATKKQTNEVTMATTS